MLRSVFTYRHSQLGLILDFNRCCSSKNITWHYNCSNYYLTTGFDFKLTAKGTLLFNLNFQEECAILFGVAIQQGRLSMGFLDLHNAICTLILHSPYSVTQQVSYIKAIDWWMSLCIGKVEKLIFERVKMKFLRYETCKILHVFHDTFWNF